MRHFHEQLQELLQKVVLMGSLVESMVQTAIAALVKQNESLADAVFAREQQVNAMQVDVDDLAVRLTCLQQPVGQDARFLFMASRIAGELERIGDQAVNICQNTRYVLDGPPLERKAKPPQPLVDLPIMAELAQRMMRNAITAMTNRDIPLANAVLEEDEKVDAFRDRVFRELLLSMQTDRDTIQRAMSMILIARNLERVGDHATNIAEEVIYWIRGRDVRHGKGLPAS